MSRNATIIGKFHFPLVTSREGRVSRNNIYFLYISRILVTSREGRVSRNFLLLLLPTVLLRHVPRGTCE